MSTKVQPILELNAFDAARDDGVTSELLTRRLRNFGNSTVLFYREPIEMVRAEGAWMYASDGRRYLDFYNNVPSVGHCHPRVVEAISRQAGQLNIHTRYLNPGLEEYAERLKATLPASLGNLALGCTGSEVNDLAMRIAMKTTGGRGFVVTEAAYHGNTLAVTEISPSALKHRRLPKHVRAVPPPGATHYGDDVGEGFAAAVSEAFKDLTRRRIRPAAFICDSIFSSDGVYADPPGFLAAAVDAARAHGACYIADEVQPGFGRTGDAMWGFERHGVEPDIVTMGKPMGNGFPMSGLATRPELMSAFCEDVGYFNTFGGNPVAAAAGLAVLDVLAEERLQDNAARIGQHLRERLSVLAERHTTITQVRGAGLFLGVEFSADGDIGQPDPVSATKAIDGLRERGVLIGAAGQFGNVLKLRPPLCLARKQADLFVDALDATLEDLSASA